MLVAIDGWEWSQRPFSVPGLHLQEILTSLIRIDPDLEVLLLHPGSTGKRYPDWVQTSRVPAAFTAFGRLRYEQRTLPRAALDRAADRLFTTTGAAPLQTPVPAVVGRILISPPEGAGLLERLRWAANQTGFRGARRVVALADLPGELRMPRNAALVAPWVSPLFRSTGQAGDAEVRSSLALPEEYVLTYGAESEDVPLLLAAWTWVDGSLGDTYPLVLLGLSEAAEAEARRYAHGLNVAGSVIVLGGFGLDDLPAIYRGAQAFLHPGYSAWGQEIRWARACGVPIAGVETPLTASILGDSAYLAQPGDSRALGAACLTLLVEADSVAAALKQKGLLAARAYHGKAAPEALLEILREEG